MLKFILQLLIRQELIRRLSSCSLNYLFEILAQNFKHNGCIVGEGGKWFRDCAVAAHWREKIWKLRRQHPNANPLPP
jgi:hypothetical protein